MSIVHGAEVPYCMLWVLRRKVINENFEIGNFSQTTHAHPSSALRRSQVTNNFLHYLSFKALAFFYELLLPQRVGHGFLLNFYRVG